eukprot:1560797-Heterocapsa_arctica.AAC.1
MASMVCFADVASTVNTGCFFLPSDLSTTPNPRPPARSDRRPNPQESFAHGITTEDINSWADSLFMQLYSGGKVSIRGLTPIEALHAEHDARLWQV